MSLMQLDIEIERNRMFLNAMPSSRVQFVNSQRYTDKLSNDIRTPRAVLTFDSFTHIPIPNNIPSTCLQSIAYNHDI